ncbi:Uncharacterised protein [Mycobacteroides abscessus subsp. abscessus]|nr:Uncharacterised protein [Mycobacteroides abscessus subsp. abscessus]SKU79491.1 Uncharacterised protein [Mycobacteroides abscessus subsp. abscessus]SKV34195.1 Uncharacterised protein [Mycobacteroides abscessus subsp. abscessus]
MNSRSRVNGLGTRFGMYLPMIRFGSPSIGSTRSSDRRNSATPTRSTLEWNGTSMPGTRMNERRPPNSSRRLSTSASSSSRPRTVPAIAYCEPRKLKFTICRNSPLRSAISATNASTSASSRPICDGRIAARR